MSDREESGRQDFTSEVLKRLAGRSGTGGRYTVKGEVARGGMGVILRVWDEDLRRHLAMKVILGKGEPSSQGDTPEVDPRLLGRFLEEAQITGQLDHPGVVPIHELGVDSEGGVYFTMKLVKGRSLKGIFELVHEGEEGWTQTRALGVLLKICEAMAYAHDKGVIHRDLKPANVMVGRFGEVYVMDWGLARVMGEADPRDVRIRPEPTASLSEVQTDRRESESAGSSLVTMDGDVVGTPSYMSPEQARGDLDRIGPASDVYALGAILYELLAGHPPYVPVDARLNAYAIWGLVQQGPPTAVATLSAGAPPEVVAICEKAMAREVEERYPDTGALSEDLRAFLEDRVVKAHRTGAVAELSKWVRRNRGVAALSMSVFALVLLGVYALPVFLNARLERLRNEEAIALAMIDLPGSLSESDQSSVGTALLRIGQRILAGDSNEEDRRRLATATVEASLGGDRYFRPGRVLVEFEIRQWSSTTIPLGSTLRPQIRLDGEPYDLRDREALSIMLLPASPALNKYLQLDILELGRHEVDGRVEVQLVRLPTADSTDLLKLVKEARAAGEEPSSLITEKFGDPIYIPLEPHTLLVLEEPPRERPLLIEDAFIQDGFARGASVESPTGSLHDGGLLLELHLPLPDVWLPMMIEVTTARGPLPGSAMATRGDEGYTRIVAMSQTLPLHLLLGPDQSWAVHLSARDQRREELTVTQWSRDEFDHFHVDLRIEPDVPVELGDRIGIRITPAVELLRKSGLAGRIEEYALVEWEGSVELR